MPFIDPAYQQMTLPGSFGALGVASLVGGQSGSAPGMTFNDTPYIHALNRALQLEHAAVAIYAAKQRTSYLINGSSSGTNALTRTEIHNSALRQLVRLIFAQRGIPDTDPAGLTAMTGTVAARVSRYMPPMVQDPMLGVSAHRIELALSRRYRQLLAMAPAKDRELIKSLLEQACEFSDQL